jgi:hypothetical protein
MIGTDIPGYTYGTAAVRPALILSTGSVQALLTVWTGSATSGMGSSTVVTNEHGSEPCKPCT